VFEEKQNTNRNDPFLPSVTAKSIAIHTLSRRKNCPASNRKVWEKKEREQQSKHGYENLKFLLFCLFASCCFAADFVSVLDYGAIADGGQTDNTVPFNNAISAALKNSM
jgi:hypothetical protein